MSSITLKEKYKIALFQYGLGDEGGLDDTIDLLVKTSSDVVKYPSKIDMSDFNTTNNRFYGINSDGYYTKSTAATIDFEALIAQIVQKAKNNPGKTILVATYLSHIFNTKCDLDTIENQAKKLIYIVDEFSKYSGVSLSLVGHSQGGLVNLETGIARCSKIKNLISISTPYSPVTLADLALFIDNGFKQFNRSLFEIFVSDDNIPYYRVCVEKLKSDKYFKDLKDRWSKLLIRPKLTVITGTAGLLYKVIPGSSVWSPNYVPDTITKSSFDGLVKIGEQKAINPAIFIDLVDKKVPCYAEKEYAKDSCYTQTGFIFSCKRSCPMSSENALFTVLDIAMKQLSNAINGGDFDDFSNNGVLLAVYAGLNRDSSFVPADERQKNLYKIFASDYNHYYIKTNPETIGYLLSILAG